MWQADVLVAIAYSGHFYFFKVNPLEFGSIHGTTCVKVTSRSIVISSFLGKHQDLLCFDIDIAFIQI